MLPAVPVSNAAPRGSESAEETGNRVYGPGNVGEASGYALGLGPFGLAYAEKGSLDMRKGFLTSTGLGGLVAASIVQVARRWHM